MFSPLGNAFFDRKNGMKPLSFHEILEEKLSLSQETTPNFYSGMVDSTCMEDLIYRGFSVSVSPRKSYPKSLRKTEIPSEKIEIPKPRTAHNLSKSQELALENFNRLCSLSFELPKGFTLVELQKAFRVSAKNLHPDHGGKAETFRDFFLSYKILLDFLASIK